MAYFYRIVSVLLIVSAFEFNVLADEYVVKSELFDKLSLVYEDSFDGELNQNFWEVRQRSTWKIVDGVLTGSESSKTHQAKMIAKGDKAHAGLKPVIWLKQVPENFVCTMKLRYSAENYHRKFPLLDIGHHIHTVVFGKQLTTLQIKKDIEVIKVEEQFLPLNEWVNVRIELKKGVLFLSMNGKTRRFESSEVDMTGHNQIDFKGVDFGTCEIDDLKLYRGETEKI